MKRINATLFAVALLLSGSVYGAPPNDSFAKATLFTGTSGNLTGTTVGATLEKKENNNSGFDQGSVWFQWTAPADGYLILPPVDEVLDNDGFPITSAYVEVTRAKKAAAYAPGQSGGPRSYEGDKRLFAVHAGELLHVRVASAFGQAMAFTLPYEFSPSVLTLSYPRRVKENAGSVAVQVQRLGRTDQIVTATFHTFAGTDPYVDIGFGDQPKTAVAGKHYTAVSTALTFNPGENSKTVQIPLMVAVGSSEERLDFELTNVAGAAVQAGRIGFGGRDFLFIESKADDPTNDNFANAKDITIPAGSSNETDVDLGSSGREPGDPGDDFSAWFKWVATSDGVLRLGNLPYPGEFFRVFTGSSLDALTPVDLLPGPLPNTQVIGIKNGVTYRIAAVKNLGLTGIASYADHINSVLSWEFTHDTFYQFTPGPYVVQEKAGAVTIPITRIGVASGSDPVTFVTEDSNDTHYTISQK